MLNLVVGAILARRAQAAAIAALTLLAVTAAAAAPWYVAAAGRTVVRADIAAAPTAQRVVHVTGQARLTGRSASVLDQMRTDVGSVLSVPGARPVLGIRIPGSLSGPSGTTGGVLAYREDFCAHLDLDGACPAAAGEAAVGAATARELGIGRGGTVRYDVGATRMSLTVVGIYRPRDPLGPYWATTDLVDTRSNAQLSSREPFFTTEETLAGLPPRQVSVDYGLFLPDDAFAAGAPLEDRLRRLADLGYQAQSESRWLHELIARDRRLVELGVAVAAAQLVALCWFALFFAVRQTAEQRRTDLGLLKLRGAARWRAWVATAGQSALPAVLSAGAGYGLGRLVASWLAGPGAGGAGSPAAQSAAAAGVAVLGILLAAVAAEWRAMRAPVVDLLRRVPARPRGWRADAVDLTVVAVALAAVYQSTAVAESWLALLAPALVALAVGLVVARAAVPLAQAVARQAVRGGRVGTALAAVHLARRPGTHRVFALLAVAVALLSTAGVSWYAADRAQRTRAVQDVGAARVLTVSAPGREHLLAAVRAADPAGRSAMAAVRSGSPPVLAVDTTRFTVGLADSVEPAVLRPPGPEPVRIGDGGLVLEATGTHLGERATHVVARFGSATAVAFGPLRAGRHTYAAALTGCAPEQCRLASVELAELLPGGQSTPAAAGTAVELHELRVNASPGDPVPFGDPTRWRPAISGRGNVPVISARDGRLALTARQPGRYAATAYLVDAPVPAPVLLAGSPGQPDQPGDPRLDLFGEALPYRVVGHVPVLPQLGTRGFLIDLEYANRLATLPGGNEVYQVWLSSGAEPAVVDRLRERGLRVLAEDSVAAARDRLDRQAPPAARRFQLLAALIGLALAAGALTVSATVERPDRSAELAALRVQGVPDRTVRVAAYGGPLALVAGAVLTGLVGALLGHAVADVALPIFVDGWAVRPIDTAPAPVPLLLVAAAAVAVLGGTAAAVARRLVGAVRGRGA